MILDRRKIVAVLAATASFFISCSKDPAMETSVPIQDFNALKQSIERVLGNKTVYFGHRSVGGNILTGIEEIAAAEGSPVIPIIDLGSVSDMDNGIVHKSIGTNGDPVSKFHDFRDSLLDGSVPRPDLVMMKLCYLDINAKTDLDAVFDEYTTAVDAIKQKHPEVVVAHMTLPLLARDNGIRPTVKRILGFPVPDREGNIARVAYNEKLMAQFGSSDPVFDLSLLESLSPEGISDKRFYKGQEYLLMQNQYTVDGGHLNEVGRRYIAEQFLVFLAEVAK